MSVTAVHDPDDVRLIAFYLPQFHPIPENDQWWGKGFTEWTNVTRARPLFEGHYQPHLPSELGFYDLRVPEVREEQARLAGEYGIHGFCYYYYWFGGRRLLERPFEEVLASGRPDFPFCLCWANETWTRRWDGLDREVLMAQVHSEEDDARFVQSLFPAFRDARYIRVQGRPLLIVYRASLLPDPARTIATWARECRSAGISPPFLLAALTFDIDDPKPYGFDGAVEFPPHQSRARRLTNALRLTDLPHEGNVFDYADAARSYIDRPEPEYPLFRAVMTGWDNTPRRQRRGYVFLGATPERYGEWLAEAVRQTRERHPRTTPRLHQCMERVGRGRLPGARPAVQTGLSRSHPRRDAAIHLVRRLPQARQPRSRRLGGDRAATDRRTLRPGGTRDPAACKRSRWA